MRVLIATGSSGGHIFPAIALLDELKKSNADVLLVLPYQSRQHKFPITTEQIKYMHTAALNFDLSSKNLLGFYSFLLGAWESFCILIKFKPDVVVGFGSLNTVALIFWAWLFRIKTMIHEQNVICGRANRLLSKLVDKVAVSFSQTRNFLNISGEKIILTGNPLRKDLVRLDKQEALDFFKFKKEKLTILITGGSQGSHRLNTLCFEALSTYQNKDNLQVIHISGVQDFVWLKDSYASSTLTYKLFDFFASMQYAYSVADLVICRAGATTIAELQRFGIAAILVPYPFAYAHQLANAQVLEEHKAACIIQDQDLTQDILRAELTQLLADSQRLESMRQGFKRLQVLDATKLLAKEVLALV